MPDGEDADLDADDEDDADAIPKCVVVDERFDWEGDRPPATPWSETVIYEVHVKGFTKLHRDVREDLRGTYAGLASDAGDRVPDVARRHRGRAAARSTTSPTRSYLVERGPHELLGLQLDRLPRAARAVRGDRHAAASRCASSRAW